MYHIQNETTLTLRYKYWQSTVFESYVPIFLRDSYGTDVSLEKKKVKLSRNRPWRPIGLWDVKDPTLSRQSAHS
jgi:hypothetical protein